MDAREDEPGGRFVLPEKNWGPGWQVLLRVGVALGCLVLATLIVYIDRNGYKDGSGQPITLLSAAYYATVSLSTTGYGDIVPVTPEARLINILIITPLRLLFLIVLVGTTVEVLTRRTQELRREKRWKKKVHHHTVVIGYGVKGRAAVATLLQSDEPPKRIMIISEDPTAVHDASTLGVYAILGDGRQEATLQQAMVPRAAKVIVATNEDDTTVLVTLAVKRLNPNAAIIAAAREANNSELIKASGATSVIPTAEASGQLLGLATVFPEAGAFMEDLLDPRKGLEVLQREVDREEIGLKPADLRQRGCIALEVIRDGVTYRFDEPGVKVFQRGDKVILIQRSNVERRKTGQD